MGLPRKVIKPLICILLQCIIISGIHAHAHNENDFLDMDISQLMQVTITSVSKRPQQLSDAAAAIYVITQSDIKKSGVTSIPEALRMVPGLQVARIGSSKWAISSRGLNGFFSNKLLVLMDGRTLYTPGFSGTYWDTQTTLLEDIDRIEVIRGPGATLWGANAVNGVINIIRKNSVETTSGLITAGAGTADKFISGFRYGSEIGHHATGRVHLTYNKRDSYELFRDGSDANDEWDSLSGGFRLDGAYGNNNNWTFQGDIYSNDEDQIVEPFFTPTPPFVTSDYSDIDASGWNLLGSWEKRISSNESLKFKAYYDYINRDESYIEQTYKTLDIEAQYENVFAEIHHLSLGVGYRYIDTSTDPTFMLSLDPNDRDDNLFSGFIQDTINILPEKLWLTIGTKWENNEFTDNELQPSARIMWQPTDNQSAWASISRAVRTPSLFERTGRVIANLRPVPPSPIPRLNSVLGNSDFDSEELIAYEAGYRWFPNTSLSFDLAFFYNDYDELLDASLILEPGLIGDQIFVNAVEGETYGFEAVMEWQPKDWLEFNLTYSFIHLDFDTDAILSNQVQNEVYEKSAPQHQVSLLTSVDFLQNWQANIWLRYVDELELASQTADILELEVDDYIECDLNIIWQASDSLELMLVGQNLLDSEHLEFISEFFTPPTEIERSFYLKALFRF